MPLSEYINRHAGETAWLFGKGESLADFDFKTAGALRCAINDVIQYIPDCQYGFSNDGVRAWQDVYQPHHTLFQPSRCLHEFDSTKEGAVACRVVTYKDDSQDERLLLDREKLAECLTIRRGTLGSALQILHVMGVKSVYMVGFDGGNHHAQGFDWRTRLRHEHGKDYDAIRSAAIDAAFIMGIALRFHKRDENMEPNGQVFVRMLKNAMAQAKPYAFGEIASFAPHIAQELIACRAAEKFIPTKEILVEQPEAKAPEEKPAVIESAMIKHAKKPRKLK